MVGSVVNK
ncbi:Protein of unknown function [Bacillus cereus]|nr:Protein of unknown function [Bacillus cereus]